MTLGLVTLGLVTLGLAVGPAGAQGPERRAAAATPLAPVEIPTGQPAAAGQTVEPARRQAPGACAETCVCTCRRSPQASCAAPAPTARPPVATSGDTLGGYELLYPRLSVGVLLGYQRPPQLAELAENRIEGDGTAELVLGWRLSRYFTLAGYLGFGGWRLYDQRDRPFNDLTTLRVGAALRLHLPLSRWIRPFAELRGGYLWVGESADDGPRREPLLTLPPNISPPEGYELAYGGGVHIPLGTPIVALTVRLLYHQLFLRSASGGDRPPQRQRTGHLSFAAGFTVQLPLRVRRRPGP
jgi:hypothetical protein